MPHDNIEAMKHYEDTILKKVSQDRIFRYIDKSLSFSLNSVFGNKDLTVWGSRDSEANRNKFNKMQPGDDILIVEGKNIKLLGKIAAKTISPSLSNELWKSFNSDSSGWDLIYFIANPLEIDVPFIEFIKLFEYKENWQLRGLTTVSAAKLEEFYSIYDDLYSILIKLKNHQKIQKKEDVALVKEELKKLYAPKNLEEEEELTPEELSDHIIMQWKLIQLGIKSGSKVWIPKNDQRRITTEYDYADFEERFSAGIDTPARYVENIDVVWKEEFRIDGAFEIENSTAIYSGLLRFSDLKIIAPNITYPLFIVAPNDKRSKVFNQINRPTFKKFYFDREVRYLSYDAVNELAEKSESGVEMSFIKSKSELAL
jgi:hypothetical protein